jgi:hypothetical protein
MRFLVLTALLLGSSAHAQPSAACKAASTTLKDMRKVEGKYTDPGDFAHPKVRARLERCTEISRLILPYVDSAPETVYAAVSVAYNESNFDKERRGKPLVGAKGEQGMMQVMAKSHCKEPPHGDGKICTHPDKTGVGILARLLTDRKLLRKCIRAERKRRKQEKLKPWAPLQLRYACALSRYNGSRYERTTPYGRKVSGYAMAVRRALRKMERVPLALN